MSPDLTNHQPPPPGTNTAHFSWREFDQLPRLIRDLINYAPTNVGTGYVYRQLQSGLDPHAVASQAVHRWRAYARRDALRLYGPTHPQAA